jgi:hypothetical protein
MAEAFASQTIGNSAVSAVKLTSLLGGHWKTKRTWRRCIKFGISLIWASCSIEHIRHLGILVNLLAPSFQIFRKRRCAFKHTAHIADVIEKKRRHILIECFRMLKHGLHGCNVVCVKDVRQSLIKRVSAFKHIAHVRGQGSIELLQRLIKGMCTPEHRIIVFDPVSAKGIQRLIKSVSSVKHGSHAFGFRRIKVHRLVKRVSIVKHFGKITDVRGIKFERLVERMGTGEHAFHRDCRLSALDG